MSYFDDFLEINENKQIKSSLYSSNDLTSKKSTVSIAAKTKKEDEKFFNKFLLLSSLMHYLIFISIVFILIFMYTTKLQSHKKLKSEIYMTDIQNSFWYVYINDESYSINAFKKACYLFLESRTKDDVNKKNTNNINMKLFFDNYDISCDSYFNLQALNIFYVVLNLVGCLSGFANGFALSLRLMEKICYDRCEQILLVSRIEPLLYSAALILYICLVYSITNFQINVMVFIIVGLNILSFINFFLTKKSFYILMRIKARI